jgi:serine/threonine-protein kinase
MISMKKLFFVLQFVILLPAVLVAQNSDPAVAEIENDSKVHQGWKNVTIENFELNYPAEWTLNTEGQFGTKLILFAPADKTGKDFRENLTVLTENISDPSVKLDKYVALSEKMINKLMSDVNFVTNEASLINGVQFHTFVYTARQGQVRTKITQYFTLKDNVAYIITFSTTPDSYDAYKEIGTRIINTFRFH